jgi:hypothetical protein
LITELASIAPLQPKILLGKLLVTTGNPTTSSEVIDLLDASNICQDLDDYPLPGFCAVGGLLNDVNPLVCGGYHTVADECYIVGQSGPKAKLLEGRDTAASLVLNHSHIWITGGLDGNQDRLSSTELVSVGQPTSKGPELPKAVYGHCLVRVNDSTALLIGGFDGWFSDESYYMSLEDQSWSQGLNLKEGRYAHTCGVFKSSVHQGRTVVIAAGGHNGGNVMNSVELLDFSTADTWVQEFKV